MLPHRVKQTYEPIRLGQLFEECNHDAQCPANAFCSTKKYGCLCQNGYGPTSVSYSGNEVVSCLPILCSNSTACESEHHQCVDSICKCIATHFDPTSAKCYRFGSTGGLPNDDLIQPTVANGTESEDSGVYTFFKDLTGSDSTWLIMFILILLSIILLVIFLILLRKNCFGHCCWTVNKNEYEPNNKNGTLKNGSSHEFDKNSINNKSFRKKSSETDDDVDDVAADKSSLVASSNNGDKRSKKTTRGIINRAQVTTSGEQRRPEQRHGYISVDVNDKSNTGQLQSNPRHKATSPLASSTSTPV